MKNRALAALVAALVVLLTVDAGCAPPGSPWTVISVRERRAGEVPFEEASHYLWPSPDANNVPGPDSLVARVRIEEKRHSYIELEDLHTKKAVRLFDANACYPHWSPDGRYIACVVWKSAVQDEELTVVDVATRTMILDPEVRSSAVIIKWSPGSHIVAAEGTVHARPREMLYTVSVPDGKVMVLDTVDCLTDYEFSWSPDGRWIAFSRPTKLDDYDQPVAADLWIAEAETGRTWLVLATLDWIESNPLWITNRTIQVDRAHWDGKDRGIKQRVVIELSQEESPRAPNRRGR